MAATPRLVVCCLLGVLASSYAAAPVFEQNVYYGTIREDAAIGDLIPGITIRASGTGVGYTSKAVCVQLDNTVRTSRLFNREDSETVEIPITATDVQGQKATTLLILTIEDANDNTPVFDFPSYTVKISENSPVGLNFLNVSASDLDMGDNAKVEFAVQSNPLFVMNTLSTSTAGRFLGLLLVNGPLDYDYLPNHRYEVVITATDQGPSPNTGTTTVTVEMENVSDEPPVFQGLNATVDFRRNAASGSIVTVVRATDPDGDGVTFAFDGQTGANNMFSINSLTGLVRLSGTLPPTDQTLFINVVATDDGTCCSAANPQPSSTNGTLKIRIVRTYDRAPAFPNCSSYDNIVVRENMPEGTSILNVTAVDSLNTNMITYGFPKEQSHIVINPTSGEITVKSKIDRENLDHILVTVRGADRGSPPLTGYCTFRIKIADENDNPPKFDLDGDLNAAIPANSPAATYVTCVIATDVDEGVNGQVAYSLLPGSDSSLFTIDLTGIIRLNQGLTGRTSGQVLTATVLVKDSAASPLNATKVLSVTLNDYAALAWDADYNTRRYSIDETTEVNINVTSFTAKAPGQSLNYYLVSANGATGTLDPTQHFSIDLNSGELKVYATLDYLVQRTYKLRVHATTPVGNYFSEMCPIINLIDTNNQAPEFAQRPEGSRGMFLGLAKENRTESQVIGEVRATDKDTIPPDNVITFRLENNSPYINYLSIMKKDNFTAQISSNYSFDYENSTNRIFRLGVIAVDGSPSTRPNTNNQPNSATVSVEITVINTNDNPPTLQVATPLVTVREDMGLGETITTLIARDPDMNNDPDNIDSLSFTILSGNIKNFFGVRSGLRQGSAIPGEIFLLRYLDFENLQMPEVSVGKKNIELTVQVEDSDPSHTQSATVTVSVIDVNDNAPEWQLSRTSFNVTEGEKNITLTPLQATDRDSGVNAQIEYAIDRTTDPGYSFSIINNNLVVTQPLMRDGGLLRQLKVLAIDKGTPALTGTATLTLTIVDINDHAPVLTGRYNLQVPEGENVMGRLVATLTATDPDLAPHADPFTFSCASTNPASDACNYFSVNTDAAGNGGKGTGRLQVKVSTAFDREQRKSYAVPVLIRDKGGANATSWVTVTVADKNDNKHTSGEQNIYVLNYMGRFGPGPVGRVYCQDADDWDLPDKTFVFSGNTNNQMYFSVGSYGVITMQPHVNGTKELTFDVTDNVQKNTAICTVKVHVAELPKQAPYRAGSARIEGSTAENFVKTQKTGSYTSKFAAFHALLASKLQAASKDVFIVSVSNYVPSTFSDVPKDYVDINFAARKGEDWYTGHYLESLVAANIDEFETLIGLTISMVPIQACPTRGTGCCSTYFDISSTPQVVNGNGTTRVGVTMVTDARVTATDRPSCNPGYCYNGGTCMEGAWNDYTCQCPPGFDGPRCQRLSRAFTGRGPLLLPPLQACIDSDVSLEFRTSQPDTSLLYNGPISKRDTDLGKPEDFFSLSLVGGNAQVRVSLGFRQQTTVTVPGVQLNDNSWHRLDMVRRGQLVWLIVDQCKNARGDDSSCRRSGVVPLQHRSMDIYTHLQVGGYRTVGTAPPFPTGITNSPFSGCIRNLTHNGQLYDLYVLGEMNSASCGCGSSCGCPLGTRGSNCATNITSRELGTLNSYMQWNLKPAFIEQLKGSNLSFSIAILFRSRDPDGVLLKVTSGAHYITVRLMSRRLWVHYDLGGSPGSLELPGVDASSGQKFGLTVTTEGRGVTMVVEGGEERYYARSADPIGSQSSWWAWESGAMVEVGCQLQSGSCVSGTDLTQTVIGDVRVSGEWLPLDSSYNLGSNAAELAASNNIQQESTPTDCDGDPCKGDMNYQCSPNCTCMSRWYSHTCRCPPGFMEAGCALRSGCVLVDDPCRPNPCWNGGTCLRTNVRALCVCAPGWTGAFCLLRAQKVVDPPAAGASIGMIVGIVVSCLILLILVIALVLFLLRKKPSDEKRVLEIYPDDDIRENVISYDEEGAGEADNAAFDIARLQVGDAEAGTLPPGFRKEKVEPLGHSSPPDYDFDDPATVEDTVRRRLHDANDDPDAPPHDSTMPFNFEGGGSDAGSLSSIESASTDRSQDFDFLNDWGDKFAKLADMYGAGANTPRSPGSESDL